MANLNFNDCTLAGRICGDPELKTTSNGTSVTTFTVAINRKGTEDTDFINIVAWKQTAEFISKYFRKGSSILLKGCINTRSYEDKDGKKCKATEIVAREVFFVDSKSEQKTEYGAKEEMKKAEFVDVDSEEGLPF